MALAATKPKIEKDRFAEDGMRMFNPTKPHGTVYADGFTEVKFIQEYEGREIQYRGDGLPVGHVPGKPLPRPADVLEIENANQQAQIKALQAQQGETLKLLRELQLQIAEQGKAKQAKPEAAETSAAEGSARAGAGKAK